MFKDITKLTNESRGQTERALMKTKTLRLKEEEEQKSKRVLLEHDRTVDKSKMLSARASEADKLVKQTLDSVMQFKMIGGTTSTNQDSDYFETLETNENESPRQNKSINIDGM